MLSLKHKPYFVSKLYLKLYLTSKDIKEAVFITIILKIIITSITF